MHSNRIRAAAVSSALLAPVAALADYHVDILPPVTPVAREIYDLHFGILWVCVAIFFIVFGAMFWSIYKHRRSMGAKAAQFHENTTIEVIWTIIPFVILVGMAYPATKTVLNMKDASNADMSIKVTAYQWKWEYEYMGKEPVRFFSNLATPHDQIEEQHAPGKTKNEHYLLEVDRPVVRASVAPALEDAVGVGGEAAVGEVHELDPLAELVVRQEQELLAPRRIGRVAAGHRSPRLPARSQFMSGMLTFQDRNASRGSRSRN